MSTASAVLLPRQMGLVRAVDAAANDIANAATPGYKAQATIFAEHVARTGGGTPSTSTGYLAAQATDFTPGGLDETGGALDLALGGQGFFKVSGPAGERLTRAGAFTIGLDGQVMDPNGYALLDGGGAPIEIPPDAREIGVSRDGTLSIDGEAYADVGVFAPRGEPQRAGTNYWTAEADEPADEPVVLQGFVERSNVSPVAAFAQLIATQRQFEAGQTLLENDHERLSALVAAIRQGR